MAFIGIDVTYVSSLTHGGNAAQWLSLGAVSAIRVCQVLCFIKMIKFHYFPPPYWRVTVAEKRCAKSAISHCVNPERFGAAKCEWAHCNRCGFGSFVAVEVAILFGQSWLNFARMLVPGASCNMIEPSRDAEGCPGLRRGLFSAAPVRQAQGRLYGTGSSFQIQPRSSVQD
jgi:hypothetical protein